MDNDSDLVTIKTIPSDNDLQIIHGYGDGGFRISGKRFVWAVFVMPRHSKLWSPAAPEKLTASAIIDLMPEKGSAVTSAWCWRGTAFPFAEHWPMI